MSDIAPLKLSALVVTRHRADWFERCIKSLDAAAKRGQVELSVIVGLNGGDLATSTVIEKFTPALRAKVTVMQLEPMLPAAARNRLLPYVTTDWVFFLDDDAYVDEHFLIEFDCLRKAHAEAVAIGGPNLTPPHSNALQRATGAALSSRFATYVSYARYRKSGGIRLCGEEALILCNLFVRRDVLDENPFPEGFICNEENWLLQTLAINGNSLLYAPHLGLWHERRPTFRKLVHQIYRYGCGRGQNIRRRPTSTRFAHIVPILCLLFAVLALLCASVQWLIVPLSLYFIMMLIAARRGVAHASEASTLIPLVCLVFPAVHVFYALGLLKGLVKVNGKS